MSAQLIVRDRQLSLEIDELKAHRLAELRAEIASVTDAIYRRTAEHFWRLGEHFAEIRKQKLWLHDEVWVNQDRSFEAWCADRAGWTMAWCEKLCRFRRAFTIEELRAAPKMNLAGFLALESAFGGVPEPRRLEGRTRALHRLAAAPSPTAGDARVAAVEVRAELECQPVAEPRQQRIPARAPVGPAVAEDSVAVQVVLDSQGEVPYLDARDGSARGLEEGRLLVLPLPGTGRELVLLLGTLGARWWVAEATQRL